LRLAEQVEVWMVAAAKFAEHCLDAMVAPAIVICAEDGTGDLRVDGL
jgi:hypothetical protein